MVVIRIADALEVSLDYLVGKTDMELDSSTLNRIQEVSKLPEEDKKQVFLVIDALIRDFKAKKPMQDNNRHLEILQALVAGTDPVTGEVFPADSPYNQAEIIRALFFAINQLETLAEKGNQSLAWSEQEDELLSERFGNGTKITELARLHSRTYGAIKARLIKLGLLQK